MRSSDPVTYIERTRAWYRALGYERDYVWARNDEVPFARLSKTLAASTVGIVTTAAPFRPDGAPALPKGVTALPCEPLPAALYTDDLAWDRSATHTDDVSSFVPARALARLAAEGRIGALARRFYCVPTEYSQRRTRERDAPEIERLCREDQIDVVLLVPL